MHLNTAQLALGSDLFGCPAEGTGDLAGRGSAAAVRSAGPGVTLPHTARTDTAAAGTWGKDDSGKALASKVAAESA